MNTPDPLAHLDPEEKRLVARAFLDLVRLVAFAGFLFGAMTASLIWAIFG